MRLRDACLVADRKAVAVTRGYGGIVNNGWTKFTEIFLVRPGSRGLRQLTRVTTSKPYSADLDHPVWAPDGQRLAFEVRTPAPGSRRAEERSS